MGKIEFRRVTADHEGTCQPCNQPTNRLVAFRVPGSPRWDGLFLCDDCLDGLQAMPVMRRIDA
jgi:hypothetical protein